MKQINLSSILKKKEARIKGFFKISSLVFIGLITIVLHKENVNGQSRVKLDEVIRTQLKKEGKASQFIKTSQGIMHVRVNGPDSGSVVLLVHGAVVGGYAFENWKKPLVDAGYKIIIPDLLGYGYSDRPKNNYTKEFYVQQLKELLDTLRIIKKVNVIGASQGGGFVLAFASAFPKRIKTVGLIAPNGGGDVRIVNKFLRAPIIGDFIFKNFGAKTMYNMISKSYKGNPAREGMLNWMKEQGKYKGYGEGVLNSIRHTLANRAITWQPEAMDIIGKYQIPAFAAWGNKDETVPYEHSAIFKNHIPQLQLFTLDGKDHAIAFGQAETILSAYIPFLNQSNFK